MFNRSFFSDLLKEWKSLVLNNFKRGLSWENHIYRRTRFERIRHSHQVNAQLARAQWPFVHRFPSISPLCFCLPPSLDFFPLLFQFCSGWNSLCYKSNLNVSVKKTPKNKKVYPRGDGKSLWGTDLNVNGIISLLLLRSAMHLYDFYILL